MQIGNTSMYEFIEYLSFRWVYILISVAAVVLLFWLLGLVSADRKIIILPLLFGIIGICSDFSNLLPLLKICSEDPEVSDDGLRESYRKFDISFIEGKMKSRLNSRIVFGLAVIYVIKNQNNNFPEIILQPPRYFNDHRILNDISKNIFHPTDLHGLKESIKISDKYLIINEISSAD